MTTGIKRRTASGTSEMSSVSAETPGRNFSGETSRLWLDGRDSASTPSSSPTSAPNDSPFPNNGNIEDVPEDNIMPLDPRRFTPTLHASLVSEILNVRREVESKSKTIDILERGLDEARTENEELGTSLSRNTKETRSLKHQLQLLEGGTSSAMTELARERDEALENVTDIRKKFEQTQKKARSREEDVERTQTLWDRERESWESERRNLERKVHVVENRLRTVLNEVAAAQAAGTFTGTPKAHTGDSSTKGSDTASVYSSSPGRRRTTSVTSMSTDDGDMQNGRYSVMSVANQGVKGDGLSLAQELAFDELDELASDDDPLYDSPGALAEERPASAHSQMSNSMGMKARKILGLSLHNKRNSTDVDAFSELKSPSKIPLPASPLPYRDSGIQYSPPPSPKETYGRSDTNIQTKDSSTLTLAIDMVSTSCQTVGDLPSPPWTPKVAESPSPPPSPILVQPTMVSAFMQTESVPTAAKMPAEKRMSLSPRDALSPPGMEIPMIAIHPPGSEPPSPRSSVVLPPQTKSASCQADMGPKPQGRSVAMQTEEIRVDQRPVKLPASLLPSAIPDVPLANEPRIPPNHPHRTPPPPPIKETIKEEKKLPEPPQQSQPQFPQPPQPSQITTRRPSDDPKEGPLGHIQAYPGNNDNGPLSKTSPKPGMRRPLRSSSLFAGFEEESPEAKPGHDIFSDDGFLNRPTATYTLRKGKMVSTQDRAPTDSTTLPEIEEHLSDAKMQLYETSIGNHEGPDPIAFTRPGPRSTGTATPGARQQDIRRAAMITSGAAAHRARPSDPSTISSGSGSSKSIAPPIPVPVRHSSRNVNGGDSGRQSPTPSSYSRNFTDRPPRQPLSREPTLRRVRSATTMSQTSQPDPFGSISSPGMSVSSGTNSSRKTSLPFDDFAAPPPQRPAPRRQSTWRDLPYGDAFSRERQDSTAASIQQTSVVDAIAQTMVGEWMFKYIRRKAFGSGSDKENWEGRDANEVSASITNSGSRHKRWVWLAPYERAIMWSSKQPTSGPALLGKSGRKLTIQSVLDVKDDNPLPKGSSPQSQFNRSILVLTPQRALKFTATSVERHYVWLTALSFLSHSSMGADELATLPSIPRAETASPTPSVARKNPIRDSIKVNKGRSRQYPKTMRPFASKPAPVPENAIDDDDDDDDFDSAAPPTVPMFSNHTRKRSHTTPRMPAVRTFSGIGSAMPPSVPTSNSGSTLGSSVDPFYPPPPLQTNGLNSTRSSFSHRTSEASGLSSIGNASNSNFFDAIGTVRMEAFIGQAGSNQPRGQRSGHRRKPSSQWSPEYRRDLESPSLPRFSESSDPFRGF